MKIYEPKDKTPAKSWALALVRVGNGVELRAVDATTGACIAYLATFYGDGTVRNHGGVNGVLQGDGYDPAEHGNKFDGAGRLIIE